MSQHTNRNSRVRSWLIPSLYAAVATTAALTFPRIEATILPTVNSGVSTPAALAVYSSIASGMIALTGIVFSLIFVMVQFSATAYSPRLALLVARDPLISHALGMFIATFVYAIAALCWLERGPQLRVPLMSGWLVIALLLASMAFFIALVERVGLLQVNRMLTFTATEGRNVIDTMYPPLESAAASPSTEKFRHAPLTQKLEYHGQPRAVQSIDTDALVALASRYDAQIEVVAAVGDVIVERTALLNVYGANGHIHEPELSDPFELGEQRTIAQDPKYAIRLLVDVAIKALSSAINDPTTATQALDQIGDLLVHLGSRRIEIGAFYDRDSHLRVLIPFPSWEDFLRLAFDEIRHYGADSVQVMRRMTALVSDLMQALPEERRPALVYWQKRLHGTIARAFAEADEQSDASIEDRQGIGTTRPTAIAVSVSAD